MDLAEQLVEKINEISGIPLKCHIGYLEKAESLSLYSLPGGRELSMDWAGNKESELHFEVGITTKKQKVADDVLWKIANRIEELNKTGITSANGSFIFESIEISGTPFVSEQDVQGYTTYLLDFKTTIIQKERKQHDRK